MTGVQTCALPILKAVQKLSSLLANPEGAAPDTFNGRDLSQLRQVVRSSAAVSRQSMRYPHWNWFVRGGLNHELHALLRRAAVKGVQHPCGEREGRPLAFSISFSSPSPFEVNMPLPGHPERMKMRLSERECSRRGDCWGAWGTTPTLSFSPAKPRESEAQPTPCVLKGLFS